MKQTDLLPFRYQQGMLHISVLFAFALAQPLFDLLSRNAEFFAVRGSSPEEVILMTLLLILAAPLTASIALWLAAVLHPRFQSIFFSGLLVLLVTLILLPPINGRINQYPWIALTISLSAGATFAYYYYRKHAIRMLLTLLTPSIALFPLLFLFNSPVYSLVDRTIEEPKARVAVSSSTPIVMVIFDELPLATLTNDENQLDRSQFPNFAALAEQGNWYRNASTVADYTTHAVPAILTGRYPDVGERPGRKDPKASFTSWFGMPTARDHPDNLFTLLSGSYRLSVYETVTSLCAEHLCGSKTETPELPQRLSSLFMDLGVVYAHIVTPSRFAAVLPPVRLGWSGFLADHGVDKADDTKDFMRFVESIDSESSPTLYFHHATLPHNPWIYLPSGEKHGSGRISGISGERWGTDEELIDQNYHDHFLQSRYADRLLGILLQKLRSKGIYQRALIIITADHGASFKAGTFLRAITQENYQDILSIPLIIKMPDQSRPLIDDRPAQTIDILPTIATILGTTLPFPVDGRSLLISPEGLEKPRTVFNKKGRELVLDFHYSNHSEVHKRKKRLQLGNSTDRHSAFYSFTYRDSNGQNQLR